MNDDGSSSVAKNGVWLRAHGDIRSDDRGMAGSVRRDNERKIRYVSGGHTGVIVTGVGLVCRIKVSACGFEIGRIAFRELVNVQGVLTRGQLFHVYFNSDAVGSR